MIWTNLRNMLKAKVRIVLHIVSDFNYRAFIEEICHRYLLLPTNSASKFIIPFLLFYFTFVISLSKFKILLLWMPYDSTVFESVLGKLFLRRNSYTIFRLFCIYQFWLAVIIFTADFS